MSLVLDGEFGWICYAVTTPPFLASPVLQAFRRAHPGHLGQWPVCMWCRGLAQPGRRMVDVGAPWGAQRYQDWNSEPQWSGEMLAPSNSGVHPGHHLQGDRQEIFFSFLWVLRAQKLNESYCSIQYIQPSLVHAGLVGFVCFFFIISPRIGTVSNIFINATRHVGVQKNTSLCFMYVCFENSKCDFILLYSTLC